ncbi:hypothetical protein [Trichloromonas sp.]|uniref:hypothetical protein n=1 Tax=Trichloromonas sp. TaxID=3069249 RepID=UPI002A3DB3F2|nr:hypothetical protein [Trichloromonas sp.]
MNRVCFVGAGADEFYGGRGSEGRMARYRLLAFILIDNCSKREGLCAIPDPTAVLRRVRAARRPRFGAPCPPLVCSYPESYFDA